MSLISMPVTVRLHNHKMPTSKRPNTVTATIPKEAEEEIEWENQSFKTNVEINKPIVFWDRFKKENLLSVSYILYIRHPKINPADTLAKPSPEEQIAYIRKPHQSVESWWNAETQSFKYVFNNRLSYKGSPYILIDRDSAIQRAMYMYRFGDMSTVQLSTKITEEDYPDTDFIAEVTFGRLTQKDL